MSTDQPLITHWPLWDEPLSKIPTPAPPLDIERARLKLARRFNSRAPDHGLRCIITAESAAERTEASLPAEIRPKPPKSTKAAP
jgi:hypothetical protein